MAGVMWLERRIAAPGPHLTLCLTEEQYRKACRHIRCTCPQPWILNDWSSATAHYYETENGLTAIVCMRGWEGRDPIEVAGLLVHEATHIWQEYAARIGEVSPGREQEAYAIQSISQELMWAFREQVALHSHPHRPN